MKKKQSSTLSDLEQFQGLIDSIYAASLDTAHWPIVVEKLQRATNSHSFSIWAHNDANDGQGYFFECNMDMSWLTPYLDYYIDYDYQRAKLRQLPAGNVYVSDELLPAQEVNLKQNNYYNEFLAPQGLHYAFGAVAMKQGDHLLLVSGQRDNRAGPYSEAERQLLQMLLPHIRRAFTISQHMALTEIHQSITEDMLNRFNVAASLVDQHGKILMLNQKAEALVEQQNGLFSINGKLSLAYSNETSILRQYISNAADYPLNQIEESHGAITVKRRQPLAPLTLLVTPTRTRVETLCFESPPATAMVFISENEQKMELSADIISTLYGLSKAEARLSVELAHGLSIEQIANKLHLSENTLRSQLRSAFLKTKTKRQTELVKLILTGPAGLAIIS